MRFQDLYLMHEPNFLKSSTKKNDNISDLITKVKMLRILSVNPPKGFFFKIIKEIERLDKFDLLINKS